MEVFRTISLNNASRARSLKLEKLVPTNLEENPMPDGSILTFDSSESYLKWVHSAYMNCGNADLQVVLNTALDTDAFVASMDPETSSAGTGPFEIPSPEDLQRLYRYFFSFSSSDTLLMI